MFETFFTLAGLLLLFVVIRSGWRAAMASVLEDFNQEARQIQARASEIGLSAEGEIAKDTFTLKGVFAEIPVTIAQRKRFNASEDGSHFQTIYTAMLNPQHIPEALTITRQKTLSKLKTALGATDIQINDTETDKRFIINGTSRHEIQELFDRPDVKQTLLELDDNTDNLFIHENMLVFEIKDSLLSEHNVLDHRLTQLIQCALAIHGTQPRALDFRIEFPSETLSELESTEQAQLENTAESW